MKNQWKILMVLVSVAALLALAIGCSDDGDEGTGPNVGNPEDRAFEEMISITDNAADLHLDVLATGFELISALGSGKSAVFQGGERRDVNINAYEHSYDAGSGWHYFLVNATVYHGVLRKQISDSVMITGIDSMRLVDTAGNYIATDPSAGGTASIEFRSNFELEPSGGPIVYDTAAFVLTGPFDQTYFETDLTANGQFVDTADVPVECDMSGPLTMVWNNIDLTSDHIYSMESECPPAGVVTMDVTFAYDCPEGVSPDSNMFVGPLSTSMTFSDGQVTYFATYNNTTWSYSEWCGPNPTDLSSQDSLFVEDVFGSHMGAYEYDLAIAEAWLVQASPPMASGRIGARLSAVIDTIIFSDLTMPSYSGGWHYVEFSAAVVEGFNDTTWFGGKDSIRVYENGNVVQWPANFENITRMETISHFTVNTPNDVFHTHHWLDYVAVGVGGGRRAQASGTMADTGIVQYGSEGSTCDADVTYDVTLSNIVFEPGSSNCPESGSVALDGTIALDCPYIDLHYNTQGDWTATGVANGDNTVTMTFNNGYTQWTRLENCNE